MERLLNKYRDILSYEPARDIIPNDKIMFGRYVNIINNNYPIKNYYLFKNLVNNNKFIYLLSDISIFATNESKIIESDLKTYINTNLTLFFNTIDNLEYAAGNNKYAYDRQMIKNIIKIFNLNKNDESLYNKYVKLYLRII